MPTPLIERPLDEEVSLREKASLVRQSNDLIQRSRYDMSAMEAKIWLHIIQKIDLSDTEPKDLQFSIREFCKLIGVSPKGGAAYRTVKDALKSVADKSMYIDIGNEESKLVRWIDSVSIAKRSGLVTVTLSHTIVPYLYALRAKFTQFPAIYTVSMKSKYSIRIYELLQSYMYQTHTIVVTLEELRRMLELPDTYEWKYMHRDVIEAAQKEINDFTDIRFTYETVRNGNSVARLIFYVEPVSVAEKDKRLSIVEERMGPDMYLKYSISSHENIEFDEVLHIDEDWKQVSGRQDEVNESPAGSEWQIPYSAGASKPLMASVLKTKMKYEKFTADANEKSRDAFDLVFRCLTSLANKHSAGEKLIDGGNEKYIGYINDILEKHQSLDTWIEIMVRKYTGFFDGKKVANPVAYLSKCVSNDLENAEILIQSETAAPDPTKGSNAVVRSGNEKADDILSRARGVVPKFVNTEEKS